MDEQTKEIEQEINNKNYLLSDMFVIDYSNISLIEESEWWC